MEHRGTVPLETPRLSLRALTPDGAQLANFKSGTWQFIDSVPNDEIDNLKSSYPDEFIVTGQLGTYYTCFNVNVDLLPATSTLTGVEKEKAEEEIRSALGLLIDRNYIVTNIGKAGQVPASSFVAMGLTDPDGTQFYQNAGHSDSYDGYYDVSEGAFESNCAAAVETLKKYYTYDEATKKFTDVPTIDYLYNTGTGHQAIGEYLQQALAVYGINVTLTNQEWGTFLNTRKDGQYTWARNGWLGDYNDPISFLDMWISTSGNDDIQAGKGDNATLKAYSIDLTDLGYDLKVENGTWAETYDAVIKLIKSETDSTKRFQLMHRAEDLLMSTGLIIPLYYYTDIYMCSKTLTGAFSSPLGFKYFMYSSIAK
ncbi:MAG: ABC transporter substrate-binding protein [Oscillospiraceae bacterium]|nr:ABC transporter substrate-binding protein [Oscillospiraceae bacterium]